MNKVYKSNNETDNIVVKPAKRSNICTLEKAIDVNINGKLFCIAHIGQMKHKDALQSCQNLNATLPLPRNLKESNHFVETFKRLGINKTMEDFSTKIILDVRRLSNTGRATAFIPQIVVRIFFFLLALIPTGR